MALADIVDGNGREGRRVHSGDTVRHVRARHFGNGFVRVAEPVTGLLIEDVTIDGAYRVLEVTAARDRPDASLNKLVMRNVRATNLQRGLARIRYDSSGGTISNCSATGLVNNEAIPCGIAFSDTAHDFTIERCTMRGFRMARAPDIYWNGDGYSTELGNYGLRFLRCEAYGCTDGGFDLKSTGTFLDGCVSGGNARNYRFWSTIAAHEITSLTPVMAGGTGAAAHIAVDGRSGAVVTIAKLRIRSETPAPIVYSTGGAATVIIESHDIQTPRGTPLLAGDPATRVIWRSGPPRV